MLMIPAKLSALLLIAFSFFLLAEGTLLRGGITTCAKFALNPCKLPGSVCKDSPSGHICERPQDLDACPIECDADSKCVKANAFFVCECNDGFFRLNSREQCQPGELNHPKQAR